MIDEIRQAFLTILGSPAWLPRMNTPPWLDRTEFPFEPKLVQLPSGESLSVTDIGSGPVIVFAHGTPTWSYEFRHLLRELSSRFRCVAPDHLGFGLSPRPAGADYRPEAHARRFGELLDVLGLTSFDLVIHDFGGPFALDAALTHPERVRRVVAFNTFAWDFGDSPRTRRMAKLASTGLFRWAYGALNMSFVISRSAWGDRSTMTKTTWKPYVSVFPDAGSRREVLWALAKSMQHSAAFHESLWNRRAALTNHPALIVWGLKDTAFTPESLAKLRQFLPRAQVLELAEAGHWPHEEQPEVCSRAVSQFLSA